jgi:4-hydroxybenzoate polyprenyltransferase
MPYYAALVGAAALCVYHQYLIRERERDACFKAFLHNNWVGAVIFAGLVLNFAL